VLQGTASEVWLQRSWLVEQVQAAQRNALTMKQMTQFEASRTFAYIKHKKISTSTRTAESV
jgi:hypothetical protein